MRASHIDTGRTFEPDCPDGDNAQRIDHRLLENFNDSAYPDLRPPQIEEQVGDELARTVIGHLPSSIGAHHGDGSGIAYVAATPGLSEGEYGRMLEQPELVGSVDTSPIGPRAHRVHRPVIRQESEPPDRQRPELRRRRNRT